jgi:hypothetical protein
VRKSGSAWGEKEETREGKTHVVAHLCARQEELLETAVGERVTRL